MTLARRLLMGAGGSGAFALPMPSGPFVLTSAPSGSWTQIPDPTAFYYNGKTYFGYVNGSNGNIEIRTYTHATGIVSAATVLHAALEYPPDTHDAPAIILRTSDRRIVAAYSAHNGNDLFVWISTNPEDISAGTETNIDGAVGSGVYTYPNLVQLSGEAGAIYLFFRNFGGGVTAQWQYTKSTNGGASWSTEEEVYSVPGSASYWKVTTDSVNRIDFAVSSDFPAVTSKVGHFYYDGTWHKSDGTTISASRPFTFTDVTQVYDSSGGPAWPTDVCLDGSNHPRIVYTIYLGGSDSSAKFTRWNGSAWVTSTILASTGADYPVACLDAAVLTQCHLSRIVGGSSELWRYTTADSGATWSGISLTPSATDDNLYPTSVKGGHPSDLAVLWLFGTYVPSPATNSLGIKGIGT